MPCNGYVPCQPEFLSAENLADRIDGAMPCHDYKDKGDGPDGCWQRFLLVLSRKELALAKKENIGLDYITEIWEIISLFAQMGQSLLMTLVIVFIVDIYEYQCTN